MTRLLFVDYFFYRGQRLRYGAGAAPRRVDESVSSDEPDNAGWLQG